MYVCALDLVTQGKLSWLVRWLY